MNLISRAYASWSLKTPPFPRRLQIETTNRCNASCLMCPLREMTRPPADMSFELFDRLAAELKTQPSLRRVILHVMGEPFVRPDFLDLLAHLRREAPHQPLEFSTNGSLLGPAEAERLVEIGPESINFSLDAYSAETHARIRRGLNFNRVLANLAGLIETVARSGRSRPRILVQLIKMDVNREEWAEFADQWLTLSGRHPFVQVYLKEQWSWGGHLESGQAAAERKRGGLAVPCGFPFDQLDVYADGRVGFCCLDQDAELTVGDLKTQSLAQIWRSERLEEMRRRFKRFDFKGLRCAECGERLRYRPLAEVGGRGRRLLGLGERSDNPAEPPSR